MKYQTHGAFMQPLIPGFLHNFVWSWMQAIPVAYVKQLDAPPHSVVLVTDDQPLRHWVVSVIGGRHFQDGWLDFCLHHRLQLGDFLVFTHQSHFVFHVSVFDAVTACLRRFSSSQSEHEHVQEQEQVQEQVQVQEQEQEQVQLQEQVQEQGISCYVTITRASIARSWLYLPREFMRSSGLGKKRICNIKLIDEKGIPWQMKLSNSTVGRAHLSSGWKDFQTAHNFRPQSVIRFQLIEAGRIPVLKCLQVISPK